MILKRLRRLREAWRLTKKLDTEPSFVAPNGETLSTEEIKKMLEVNLPVGDGKAEFLGDEMSEEEYQKYKHDEEEGWGAVLKRTFSKDA